MVYYNPEDVNDDQFIEMMYGVDNAIKIIDIYMEENLSYPNYPISKEKGLEIAQKRVALEGMKDYILTHQKSYIEDQVLSSSVCHLADTYTCYLHNRLVESDPQSEAFQLFFNMYSVAEEVMGYFL